MLIGQVNIQVKKIWIWFLTVKVVNHQILKISSCVLEM